MHNKVTPNDLAEGAEWTFVHSSGKRTLYIYERQMVGALPSPDGKSPGLDAMHRLLNPETSKYAEVTERWMRGMSWGDSHWLVGNQTQAEIADVRR